MTTIEKINKQLDKIEALLKSGKSLQEITKITYQDREADPANNIYFGWGQKNSGIDKDYIMPMPVKGQKEFYEFFNRPAPGMKVLPENTLWVYKLKINFQAKSKVNSDVVIRRNLRS